MASQSRTVLPVGVQRVGVDAAQLGGCRERRDDVVPRASRPDGPGRAAARRARPPPARPPTAPGPDSRNRAVPPSAPPAAGCAVRARPDPAPPSAPPGRTGTAARSVPASLVANWSGQSDGGVGRLSRPAPVVAASAAQGHLAGGRGASGGAGARSADRPVVSGGPRREPGARRAPTNVCRPTRLSGSCGVRQHDEVPGGSPSPRPCSGCGFVAPYEPVHARCRGSRGLRR